MEGAELERVEERLPRRRRSALRTPSFVDRMDLSDDAEGRVAVFTVADDEGATETALALTPRTGGALHHVMTRLGTSLDATYAGVAVAVALAVVLALGLLLLRR